MQRTIFTTPVINELFYWISCVTLKIIGWEMEGETPALKKFVLIIAPHTSNWDLPIGMLIVFYSRNSIYFLGKHQLFRKPFGPIMRWLGGIPVDRTRSNNIVSAVIDEFNRNESLIIAISPDGSRRSRKPWKTGFYHIAAGAGVPISLAFIDYGRKKAGYGKLFYPTGDIENDFEVIKDYYKDIRGKYPK